MKRVQEQINTHFRDLQDTKNMDQQATLNQLRFLIPFNQQLTKAMSRSIANLTESSLVSLSNFVLLRRDAFLDYTRQGIQPDTLAALCTSPLYQESLFPEALIQQAEREIVSFETSRVAVRSRHPWKKGSKQASSKGDAPQKPLPSSCSSQAAKKMKCRK